MDRLATHLGIAGPESQEERNTSSLYQRAVLQAAIEQIKGAHGEGIDARMKAAGMMTIAEMLESPPLTAFHVHAGVTDLDSFEKWLVMEWQSYTTQQAELQLDNREDDELFEWVVAHSAVFLEVLINFRAANTPPTEGVAMPKELTAENGAKALMMGEFYETVEIGNEAFCGCGTCDFCIECPDEPESTLQKIPISWTTIKEIEATHMNEISTRAGLLMIAATVVVGIWIHFLIN
tara:strand:- start:268 stop:972 length:705 start_codon:yes stop_codon:yes gene_type:complete